EGRRWSDETRLFENAPRAIVRCHRHVGLGRACLAQSFQKSTQYVQTIAWRVRRKKVGNRVLRTSWPTEKDNRPFRDAPFSDVNVRARLRFVDILLLQY